MCYFGNIIISTCTWIAVVVIAACLTTSLWLVNIDKIIGKVVVVTSLNRDDWMDGQKPRMDESWLASVEIE